MADEIKEVSQGVRKAEIPRPAPEISKKPAIQRLETQKDTNKIQDVEEKLKEIAKEKRNDDLQNPQRNDGDISIDMGDALLPTSSPDANFVTDALAAEQRASEAAEREVRIAQEKEELTNTVLQLRGDARAGLEAAASYLLTSGVAKKYGYFGNLGNAYEGNWHPSHQRTGYDARINFHPRHGIVESLDAFRAEIGGRIALALKFNKGKISGIEIDNLDHLSDVVAEYEDTFPPFLYKFVKDGFTSLKVEFNDDPSKMYIHEIDLKKNIPDYIQDEHETIKEYKDKLNAFPAQFSTGPSSARTGPPQESYSIPEIQHLVKGLFSLVPFNANTAQ